jgi:catechol 2,3-dioxygenase-like lactoylglutathione lyase family enzyme
MAAIRFTQIDHCSVLITDLARARWFYGDVLGLKEIAKPKTFDFVALWFSLSDDQTLHLLQKPHPDTISPRHFALRVPDARAAREHFRSCGVEIQETGPIPHCDRFFVRDPDGNRIELIQWIEPYDPAKSGATHLD